ncbi:MAG TPA: gephyrin-like molybdotransferase Glp [Gemmatimonadaceae bacterium]|nr:gephyrin-like molybdotransferase Glp [Gemmatimonadaceae bacterium]
MLSVHEASARMMQGVSPLPRERVPLLDALGLVLAQPAVAPLTVPPWDNSAMDGYAVRAVDISGASEAEPVALRVTETVAAGGFATGEVSPGTAIRIMTGAPIPGGADTVVRLEDTDGGTTDVRIRNDRDASRNVRARGEDFHEGDNLLDAGTSLGAAQIGVLSSIGAAAVAVHRRPRVAILGSGDELVDLDAFHEVRAGRKIASSNNYTLHALIRESGGVPVNLGIARDDPADLREHLLRASGSDLLVTTAGVSVGEFDYTRDVLSALGAKLDFWKIRMRPGAPLGFGSLSGVPWVGLPGNPVSTMVTFELFVRPMILRLLGHTRCFRRPVAVVLEEPVRIGARLTHFLRAILTPRPDGSLGARLTGPQGSGILTSMIRANALLVVPMDRPDVAAGETLTALPLGDGPARDAVFAV